MLLIMQTLIFNVKIIAILQSYLVNTNQFSYSQHERARATKQVINYHN